MKYLKSILKYSATLFIALALLWYIFRDLDLQIMFEKIKRADFTFVYISIGLSLISHFLRGYRWTLLLKPIGYNISSFRAFIAVMVGYFANLLVPRMGEVTRCTILKKTDKVAIPASLGSVISERLLDLILLVAVILATIIIEFGTLKNYIYNTIMSAYESFDMNRFLVIGGLIAVIFLLGFLYVIKNKKIIKSWGLYQRIRPFAFDLLNGLNSILKVQNKTGFFLSTLFIWIFYYLMSYIIVFSFPATSDLDLSAGLSILMAGGLGMTAPVQGGIGTYHAFVSGVLLLYGISKEDGVLFATLLHTSQFISLLFFGGISFLISLFLKKEEDGHIEKNSNPQGSH